VKKFYIFIYILIFSFSTNAETLYLGTIGDDPKDEIEEYNNLAIYLEDHLTDMGITEVKIAVAPNSQKMAQLINEKKVHIYIDSPFPSILLSNETGSTIFLRRWKKGKEKYRSVVFSRIDSGIVSIEDMRGKMMAFEEPFSTSAYFLPKATLSTQGVSQIKLNEGEEVPANKTGYLFSDDDKNTMTWVFRKKVDIGAMSESSYYQLAKKRVKDLHIITQSIWVPRHVVSYAPGMEEPLVEKIKNTLINMHKNVSGQKALLAFSKTTKFDEFPGGIDAHLIPLNALLKAE